MPPPAAHNASPAGPSFWARLLRILRPSHQHTAFSATLLMISAVMLSRVIGYLREAYIARAHVGAFNLPDFLNYILAGGTAAITFIAIYTRHTSKGRDREAQETSWYCQGVAVSGDRKSSWLTTGSGGNSGQRSSLLYRLMPKRSPVVPEPANVVDAGGVGPRGSRMTCRGGFLCGSDAVGDGLRHQGVPVCPFSF